MKKILLTIIISLTLLGCSKNEENTTPVPTNKNKMKEVLIGTWKLIGYYDDIEDPETGSNYHLIENGDIYKFSSNGNFDNVGDDINPDGTYSVSLDSVLTRNYNSNSLNPNITLNHKVFKLTNKYMEFYPVSGVGTSGWLERYEKVNP
jgi:hypothetical protein